MIRLIERSVRRRPVGICYRNVPRSEASEFDTKRIARSQNVVGRNTLVQRSAIFQHGSAEKRRRLISAFAGQGPSSQQNRSCRPLASALTH